jgi:WD40 repeat protein
MKRRIFYLLLGMILLSGCSRGKLAATATAPIEVTPTVEAQQLEAEARALASESTRLWHDGEYSQALAMAVKAVHKTYSTPETCGTVVEEAEFALTQAMFSSELPDMSLSEHLNDVKTASFSPDGKRIVTVSSKDAKIWDATTGHLLYNLKAHLYSVESAVFSPDANLVLTASADGSAKVWHANTGLSSRRSMYR